MFFLLSSTSTQPERFESISSSAEAPASSLPSTSPTSPSSPQLAAPALKDATAPEISSSLIELRPLSTWVPPEIISLIIEHSSTSSLLASWCLASSASLQIAGPALYEYIIIHDKRQADLIFGALLIDSLAHIQRYLSLRLTRTLVFPSSRFLDLTLYTPRFRQAALTSHLSRLNLPATTTLPPLTSLPCTKLSTLPHNPPPYNHPHYDPSREGGKLLLVTRQPMLTHTSMDQDPLGRAGAAGEAEGGPSKENMFAMDLVGLGVMFDVLKPGRWEVRGDCGVVGEGEIGSWKNLPEGHLDVKTRKDLDVSMGFNRFISQSTLQRIMNRISATAASLRWTESDVLTIDMYIEAAIAWRDALKWLTEDLQADVQDLEEMKREKEERERGVREEEKGEEEEEENEQEKEGADEEGEGVLLREKSAAIEV